jgi:hypothetical protein
MQNSNSAFDSDGDHNATNANNVGHNFLQRLQHATCRDIKIKVHQVPGKKSVFVFVIVLLVVVIIPSTVYQCVKTNNTSQSASSKTNSTTQVKQATQFARKR